MPDVPDRPRVLLANINPGVIRSAMAQGLIDSLTTGRASGVMMHEAGPYLDRERNIVVAGAQQARQTNDHSWDWLLFIDSDIEFNASHIDSLLSPTQHPDYDPAAHPVLCGLYHSGFPDIVPGSQPDSGGGVVDPVVYEWVSRTFDELPEADPIWAFRRLSRLHLAELPGIDAPWNIPPLTQRTGPVCSVGAAGTGFMAIHHSILSTLEHHHPLPLPYFDEPVINGVHLGEDLAFCHRVTTLGYPVLVNRACVVLHHKTMRLA